MERDRLAENLVHLERLLGSQSTEVNGEETIHLSIKTTVNKAVASMPKR